MKNLYNGRTSEEWKRLREAGKLFEVAPEIGIASSRPNETYINTFDGVVLQCLEAQRWEGARHSLTAWFVSCEPLHVEYAIYHLHFESD